MPSTPATKIRACWELGLREHGWLKSMIWKSKQLKKCLLSSKTLPHPKHLLALYFYHTVNSRMAW
jgi:hypothetical protein